jgi:AcrR family transcriptional regulator
MTIKEAISIVGKPAGTARLITAAARRCFLDVGYESCSMDAIARHADVSKATLYAHFASKEALFVAVMQTELEAFNERLGEFEEKGYDSLAGKLVAIGTTILSQMLEEDTLRLFRIAIAEGARLPDPCRTAMQNRKQLVYRSVTDIFADAGSENPAEAARLFMALIKGDLVWDCLLGARQPPQIEEIQAHIQAVVQGMMRFCSTPCSLSADEANHA